METSPDKTLSIPKPLNKPANNRVVVPELSGDVSIGKRPMDRVLRPLKSMNANIEGIEDNYTPLIII
jgi:5-enolpyruvylshikimate-3-phosphate synthase